MALCPVCRHALPESTAAFCPNCGASVSAEAPAGSPPPPLPLPSAPPPLSGPAHAGGPGGRRFAWDDRERTGILTTLVETTRDVLTAPREFFREMPVGGGLGSPILYALIVGWVGLAAAAFYQAIFNSITGGPFSGFGDRPELASVLGFMESWAGFVAQVVFGGVFVVIGVFIAAGILHLMLMLLGGARRDFEATVRVVSFSQATSLLFLLPFCGQLIGAVWTIVLYVVGLAEAHQIGAGKAAVATLLPLFVFCCCCVGVLSLFFGAIAAAVPGLAGAVP
jgi:hypothetical protein